MCRKRCKRYTYSATHTRLKMVGSRGRCRCSRCRHEEAVTSGREYASQKPDRRHPCRPSEHRRWFGDTAPLDLMHGGRRNGRSSDGGTRSGVDEKMSCGVSLPVKRTSPFIEKTLNSPCFDLPDIQEPPPGISRRPPTMSPHIRGRAYPAPRADVAV
jgi:hypothetical protein